MIKLGTCSVLSALLSLIFVSAPHAQQISPQLAQKAPEAATIVQVAEQNGYVRVIVEFAEPVAPGQLRPDPTFLADVKTRIAALQDTIIASHFGSATNPTPGPGFPRAIHRFDITPGFAVNVTQTELNALAADPQVLRINYDRLQAPLLLQSVPLAGMPNAYASGGSGLGQAVAVIDTGVQSNHEFLSGKVVMEACFSNSGGTGVTLCPNGMTFQTGTGAADPETTQCLNASANLCLHGTHVAGIAAGNNTNPTAVAGGAPANGAAKSAKIVAVQVFTRFNDNPTCSNSPPCVLAFDSDTVSALNWLFQNALTPAGVKLASANMSLGGGLTPGNCDADSRKAPIDNLRGVGVATAIAAGNNGSTFQISAPSCISTAVAVASSDKNDVISSFSNMSSAVALIAPGGFGSGSCAFGANNPNILSSIAISPPATNGYTCLAGTSMATPHVAGTFAAIRSACPNATVDQILAALQNTGLPITDTRTGGTQTKPRIRVNLAVQQLGCSNGPRTATHEFNDDSKSDVLWRNTNGGIAMWLMSSATISSSQGVGSVPMNWQIVGQRDFNGDGFADILWRDSTGGGVAMWLMNGATVNSSLGIGNVPTNWGLVGTGDFDGDGKGDILWRDNNSGAVAVWLMNGNSIVSSAGIGTVPLNWVVAGTGDFNGDGKWDILWRDTSGGGVAMWLMNGTIVTSSLGVGNVSPNWVVAGTGDFNGDGKRDILWRDTNSGGIVMWLMDGGTIGSSVGVGNVPNNWQIPETGDFNGDGMSDILWRDNNSGGVAMWLMNGGTVQSSLGVGNVPTDWQIQGMNAD